MRRRCAVAALACMIAKGCHSAPGSAGTAAADPSVVTARIASAQKLTDENKLAEAERILRSIVAADDGNGAAHTALGVVYYKQSKLYLAAWEFEAASRYMPNRPEPLNNLGLTLEAAGKFDDAVAEYGRAMKLAPESEEIVANLARARVRRGDSGPEIVELLRRVASQDPRPEWVAWAQLRLHSAAALPPDSDLLTPARIPDSQHK